MLIKRISSVVLVGSLLLICSGVAAAQRPAGQMARLRRALTLTDTQAAEIGALLKKHREAVFPVRQDLQARNHDLKDALDATEPNPNTVGQLAIARRGLTDQLRALNGKLRSDIAALLTPEQKQKFEELKARTRTRLGRGRGRNNLR